MPALKDSAMSFRNIGSNVRIEYVFALALLPYGLRSMPYIGFSLKKFAGSQENP